MCGLISKLDFLGNFSSGVTIGIVSSNYTVLESDGEVEVCVQLSLGSLEREAIVSLSTADSSAVGKYL